MPLKQDLLPRQDSPSWCSWLEAWIRLREFIYLYLLCHLHSDG